ncbi:anaerobic benzoate catabolism transcriptional regulator [Rubripirellula obstinata]|uniref:Anaerobic benzoate catabolism transcriptional regulator n=2 Tax=Pirellulaceae TaxID=2691357 RepID=A0A5B1CGD5_9BACT|nr:MULTISPECIES: helix-turn-helix transcriptional regulator [Pirellulaceae]EMI20158.1 transcriptional regulator, XRE family [Rhodopirellula maiorica SM1]KAA1258593.1 anaerobic benzoate catabolism transcriptional regulator [Rubripirellula obstinata]
MEEAPKPDETPKIPLAENLRKFREEKGLSLDQVAKQAKISKAYLWELERDTEGTKKPSAVVLMQIADALSRTLADLLSLPSVQTTEGPREIPASLVAFRDRLKSQGTELSESDLQDLAKTRFRGGQPQTPDEWHQLYLLMASNSRKPSK